MQINYEILEKGYTTVRKGTTLYYIFLKRINRDRYKIEIYSKRMRTKRNFLLENGFAAEPAKRMFLFNKEKVFICGNLETALYKFEQIKMDIKAGTEIAELGEKKVSNKIEINKKSQGTGRNLYKKDELNSAEISDYIVRKRNEGFTYFKIAENLADYYNVDRTVESVRNRYLKICEERGVDPIKRAHY